MLELSERDEVGQPVARQFRAAAQIESAKRRHVREGRQSRELVPGDGGGKFEAVLAGRVQVYFAVLPTVLSFIRSGQLKALATGDQERVAALPDVPTLKEAGIPGIVIGSWNALYVKAGTPAPVLARLRAETEKILKRPDVIARIAATDAVAKPISAERMGQMTAEEYEAYGRIAKEGNITLN